MEFEFEKLKTDGGAYVLYCDFKSGIGLQYDIK